MEAHDYHFVSINVARMQQAVYKMRTSLKPWLEVQAGLTSVNTDIQLLSGLRRNELFEDFETQ